MIPGSPPVLKAWCVECGRVWRMDDTFNWRRHHGNWPAIGIAVLLLLLFWIAGHAEVMT